MAANTSRRVIGVSITRYNYTVMRKSLLLFIAAFTLIAAPPDAKKAGCSPERLAKIPERMKEFVDRGDLSGVVTLVARHGVVASLDAVGWQNVEDKKPMRTDSIFQIMSMTKPVTAVGIMMLVEEGKLRLTDPIEKFIPEFRGQMLVQQIRARIAVEEARATCTHTRPAHSYFGNGRSPGQYWSALSENGSHAG